MNFIKTREMLPAEDQVELDGISSLQDATGFHGQSSPSEHEVIQEYNSQFEMRHMSESMMNKQ